MERSWKVLGRDRLTDAVGGTQPDLFAFGPITRETFGKMTGVPDIVREIERVVPIFIGADVIFEEVVHSV
jgi:uncharacterized NAD(P)/FAD-binding protein YdhS